MKNNKIFCLVCGTTGKRKACKDCSCGLKEELEAGTEPTPKSVTSSCGSVSYCNFIRQFQVYISCFSMQEISHLKLCNTDFEPFDLLKKYVSNKLYRRLC